MMSIGMVAGETSGDLIAGMLLKQLQQDWPNLKAVGIGGPTMKQQGFLAWWPNKMLSLIGFGWDVLRQLRKLLAVRAKLQHRLMEEKIQIFIGIDAPDFNLTLEKNLRRRGIKTIHYVCPSIWAWRENRVKKIKSAADHVLCVFPFEPEILAKHGISATFVGHPLANVIPLEPNKLLAREKLGLPSNELIIAILPGSRSSEIKALAHLFFMTASRVRKKYPNIHIVVPALPSQRSLIIQAALNAGFDPSLDDKIHFLAKQSHLALEACDLTLIASGTATLEAALFKRPMVISYKLNFISRLMYLLYRNKNMPWVGLPNIILRRFAVPELLQEHANELELSQALFIWLEAIEQQSSLLKQLEIDFMHIHTTLRCDNKTLALNAIKNLLEKDK
jgi:lipid-A-disaccharide synthase